MAGPWPGAQRVTHRWTSGAGARAGAARRPAPGVAGRTDPAWPGRRDPE